MSNMRHLGYFLVVLIQSQSLTALYFPQEYVVPEPTFQVFSSGGFSVSIPHEDGIDLFAFHGSINRPMRGLESGQFSKDVLQTKNDKWMFEDKRTKLERGDVIYFWLLVVKDTLGYRYNDGRFVVKDIVQKQAPNPSHASSGRPTTQSNSDDKTQTSVYSPLCQLALNLSSTVDELKDEVKLLREMNDVLKDIIAKDETSTRTLRFQGVLPPFDDPLYTVQMILQVKLGLHMQVLSATKEKDDSIVFQVDSLDDKLNIIRAAKKKLENNKSKIVLTY